MTDIYEDFMEGDHLIDLLADEQTLGLDEASGLELEELICGATAADRERVEFERVSAAAAVAMTEIEPCPADVLERAKASFAGGASPVVATLETKPTEADRAAVSRNYSFHYAGWFAAAACFVLAVVASWPAPSIEVIDALARAEAMVIAAPDTVTLAWESWDGADLGLEGGAEIMGVSGEVVWSDEAQAGYMTFAGLPKLEDSAYQLWIIDADRGLAQRISGGVFNGNGDGGQHRVAIDETPIPVNSAAAFAVTIEKPGGTWVSDMSRRVVIAARG